MYKRHQSIPQDHPIYIIVSHAGEPDAKLPECSKPKKSPDRTAAPFQLAGSQARP